MKLWSGRFTKSTHALAEAFNASIGFDYKLAVYDIQGSIAHVKTLHKAELLTATEMQQLISGLEVINQQFLNGEISWTNADEDIHMKIETLLTQMLGPVAGKLHTGRSRNDQVSLDLHLYCKDKIKAIQQLILSCQNVLNELALQHSNTFIPGYTHLQRAQPVRLAQHLLVYVQMLQRDYNRLQNTWDEANICPLGAGALAGNGFDLDSNYSATLLGFASVYTNSMDAVSNRDFVLSLLADLALLAQHLSRLAEELILWNSQEFAFIQFDDAFATGSSMLPQKKNPDIAELIRGKTGRIYGNLMAMLTTLKGLPLTYNKDLQEDKEALFDSVEQISLCLEILAPLLATMTINTENMLSACKQGFLNAAPLANYCVQKGMPFREAHALVGSLVKYCIANQFLLEDLSLEQLQTFNSIFAQDCFAVLDLNYD